MSLYRKHVPILLKAVPELNRRNLYPTYNELPLFTLGYVTSELVPRRLSAP
jgi:hypothetical protein